MKNVLSSWVKLCTVVLLPGLAFAAADFYLQIKDAKGETRVVQCPAGACVVDALTAGQYSVLICDAQGRVIPSNVNLEYTVVSPRDVAMGQATAKRMHKPLSITIELSRGAPRQNILTIDESGVTLAIGTTPEAVDTAAAKIGKSRSNIQNN